MASIDETKRYLSAKFGDIFGKKSSDAADPGVDPEEEDSSIALYPEVDTETPGESMQSGAPANFIPPANAPVNPAARLPAQAPSPQPQMVPPPASLPQQGGNQELKERLAKAQEAQMNGVKGQYKNLAMDASVPSKLDLSPAYAYLSTLPGGKKTEYIPPQALEKTNEDRAKLLEGIQAQQAKANAPALALLKSQEVAQNKMDFMAHQRTLSRLANDKPLGQRLVQYQNLDNALSNLTSADKLTPQQIDEAQQAIRSNLGIKGNSGISERQHTYLNSLGLNVDRFEQFLTGDPAEISKDNKLLAHIQNLAQLEQKNIRGQYQSRLNTVSAGNGSMYARRPDLSDDLKTAIEANQSQIAPAAPQADLTPDVLQFAKEHGITPAKALEIKNKRSVE